MEEGEALKRSSREGFPSYDSLEAASECRVNDETTERARSVRYCELRAVAARDRSLSRKESRSFAPPWPRNPKIQAYPPSDVYRNHCDAGLETSSPIASNEPVSARASASGGPRLKKSLPTIASIGETYTSRLLVSSAHVSAAAFVARTGPIRACSTGALVFAAAEVDSVAAAAPCPCPSVANLAKLIRSSRRWSDLVQVQAAK